MAITRRPATAAVRVHTYAPTAAAKATESRRDRTRRIVGSDGTRPVIPNAARTSTGWSPAHSAITV